MKVAIILRRSKRLEVDLMIARKRFMVPSGHAASLRADRSAIVRLLETQAEKVYLPTTITAYRGAYGLA